MWGWRQRRGEEELQSVCLSLGCDTQLTELEASHLLVHGALVFLREDRELWEEGSRHIFPAQATYILKSGSPFHWKVTVVEKFMNRFLKTGEKLHVCPFNGR